MKNQGYRFTDRITRRHAGWTVLEYYAGCYSQFSRQEWSQRVADGRIVLNDAVASATAVLSAGDVLHYLREAWEEPDTPQEFDVLAETEQWMVFNKPTGLPVLPGGGFLEHTMLHIARERFGPGVAPVHRLGRGTTGAILFSRDETSAAFLAAAMRERRISKTYLALVEGAPPDDSFTVDVPIGPVPHALLGIVHAANQAGKPSLSHCTVLRREHASGYSLVEVRIPTGRPHQIRIHLAAAGYPLLGDPLYLPGGLPRPADDDGRQPVPGDCGYILHSWKLVFPDPLDGSTRCVVAPPDDERLR